MAEKNGEPAAKKFKYSLNDGDFKVTDEILKDFHHDGYIMVKLVTCAVLSVCNFS